MIPRLLIRIGSRYLPILEVSVSDEAITGISIDDLELVALAKAVEQIAGINILDKAIKMVEVEDVTLYEVEIEDGPLYVVVIHDRAIRDTAATEEPT